MALVRRQLSKVWPVLVSGLLFALALPPANLGLLTLVAMVPWLLSLKKTNGKGAFRGGYLLGILIWASQMWWVVVLTGRWTGSTLLGLAPLAVICFLGSFYFGLTGVLIHRAIARGWWWAIPLLWAGIEVGRSYMPALAFPYALLATPLWPYPAVTQSAYFGTVYFVSAWVMLVNVLAALWLGKISIGRPVRQLAIVAVLIPLLSLMRFLEPSPGKIVRVVAGQPGVDLAYTSEEEEASRLIGSVGFLYAKAKEFKADLLVLPEGVANAENDQPPITPFAVQANPPVLFGARRIRFEGAIGSDPHGTSADVKTFQSAYGYDGKWQHADKARLVVFGEYVPGRGLLPFLDSFKLPSGDLSAAEKTQSVKLNGLNVGPMLCFEGMFFDVAQAQVNNGAQLLTVQCIDDWYMGTPAPDQLRTAAVWRAVETGLPVVRVGGLGYTMIIDSRGRVRDEAPLNKTTALAAAIHVPDSPPPSGVRPYVPWAFLVFLFGAGGTLLARRPPRKKD